MLSALLAAKKALTCTSWACSLSLSALSTSAAVVAMQRADARWRRLPACTRARINACGDLRVSLSQVSVSVACTARK